MKNFLLSLSLVLSFSALMAYAVTSVFTLPDVYVSYSTGYCVNVVNYAEGDDYTCENMPKKFNHVWVQ